MDEEGQEILAFLNMVDMVGVEELDRSPKLTQTGTGPARC